MKVYTVLVIDATTGQNGLQQAREFNKALDLDALILTKLDGTAKGGIALAISHELNLPIIRIGVGEAIDDLRTFDANDFVRALIGDYEEDDLQDVEDEQDADDRQGEDSLEIKADFVNSYQDASEVDNVDICAPATPSVEPVGSMSIDDSAITHEEKPVEVIEVVTELGDSESSQMDNTETHADEQQKLSWAEFVELDEARKAEEASKPKKHFWEKW